MFESPSQIRQIYGFDVATDTRGDDAGPFARRTCVAPDLAQHLGAAGQLGDVRGGPEKQHQHQE